MLEIRKIRKDAGSVVISLTGFVQIGEHYKIEKIAEDKVLLTKVE